MSVRQKFVIILENTVVQKLKLENNAFAKKLTPELIFLNGKTMKIIGRFLTSKIDFESTKFFYFVFSFE